MVYDDFLPPPNLSYSKNRTNFRLGIAGIKMKVMVTGRFYASNQDFATHFGPRFHGSDAIGDERRRLPVFQLNPVGLNDSIDEVPWHFVEW